MKRLLTALICALLILSGNAAHPKVAHAYSAHTAQEAIGYVQSLVGKYIDKDGAYGAQCVDLILAYYDYLGVPRSSGNGADYTHNTLPSGWQRLQGVQPQYGDILVYTGGYGHVAIYESDRSTYHQNFNTHPYVEHITNIRYNGFENPYWGVIRPDFPNSSTPPSVTWSNESCDVTRTNAVPRTRANFGSSGSFTEAGIILRDSAGNIIGQKSEDPKYTGTYLNIWYDINSELGVTLSPGTAYSYEIYVVFNGNRYSTGRKTFTTESIPVSGISVSPTSLNLKVGATSTLTATVSPSNASNKAVTWISSNYNVAAVNSSGKVTARATGSATITARTVSGGKQAFCTVIVSEASSVKAISMHRLYNPNSGEHFYTANVTERNHLVNCGWRYEGIGWKAPEKSSVPVYRLYNKVGGEHHYTTNLNERVSLIRAGWTDEGIGWYSDPAQHTPLYRQYNPNAFANNHNYTASTAERDWLISLGWRDEGIGWYGL
ncbi:MAG: Ig-like domain-containing protein [Bilifractor sp.]